jgi:hypothetical protein
MSPFDHPAMAMSADEVAADIANGKRRQAHLNGFSPYRKLFANENRTLTTEQIDQILSDYNREHNE